MPRGPQREKADGAVAPRRPQSEEAHRGPHRPPRPRRLFLLGGAAVHGRAALGLHVDHRDPHVHQEQREDGPQRGAHPDVRHPLRHAEPAERDHDGRGPLRRGPPGEGGRGGGPRRGGADDVPRQDGLDREPRLLRDGAGGPKGLLGRRLEVRHRGAGGHRRGPGARRRRRPHHGAADAQEGEGRRGHRRRARLRVPLRRRRGEAVLRDARLRRPGARPRGEGLPRLPLRPGPPRHRGARRHDHRRADALRRGPDGLPEGAVRPRLPEGPQRRLRVPQGAGHLRELPTGC
mmetsp:Transcript_121895/g.345474  ORF Transcript_121895/g.345474 Transcript_121895/m.345474 type:complete len:290 (-) Transcript_121895:212-1081(-)